jgi:hypothetical protein
MRVESRVPVFVNEEGQHGWQASFFVL